MEEIIRQYRKEDRAFIRNIAWDTAFIGEPADAFFDDKEILVNFLTAYYTDYEPDSCFVAINSNGRVIGYLLGAKNLVVLKSTFQDKIFPRLLILSIINGALFKRKNLIFIFHCLISFLRQEFIMPDFSQEYPACLHINLEENWRNLQIGSRLITAYLDYWQKQKYPVYIWLLCLVGQLVFLENRDLIYCTKDTGLIFGISCKKIRQFIFMEGKYNKTSFGY